MDKLISANKAVELNGITVHPNKLKVKVNNGAIIKIIKLLKLMSN